MKGFKIRSAFRTLLPVAAAALAIGGNVAPARSETVDIPVPKALITTAMNAYAQGIEIQLDNWGSWNGSNWHTDNSRILFPSGRIEELDIDQSPTITSAFRRYNGYVNDMTSQTISVKLDGNRFKLNVFFESAGDELKIGCINRRRDKPCKAHLLKHSGQVNNAQVSAWLEPVLKNGEISFKQPEVRFDFDLQPDSWLLDKGLGIVNWFKDTDSLIKTELTEGLQQGLKEQQTIEGFTKDLNEEIIDRVADRLSSRLGNRTGSFIRNNLEITRLRSAGRNYVVTVQYPDPVTRRSLKIEGLEVMGQNRTISCPGKVTFDATIKTDYAMSGQVWLEHENGKTTKKLNWANGKNQTTTSKIERNWNRRNFQSNDGWSRLVVSYKDVFGTTHTKKSAKATFQRTCRRGPGGLTR